MFPGVYNQDPLKEIKSINRNISVFNTGSDNIDHEVVGSSERSGQNFTILTIKSL
jgi:hypothetical protein